MAYTASVTGQVQYQIDKPPSTRWHLVVSDGACGSLTSEVLCHSDITPPSLSGFFSVTQGTTYYFYLIDTTSGTLPLDNPLTVTINEVPACTPGTNGLVGDTVTTIPTGWASFTEYYVAADPDPNGWVYVGGLTALRRIPRPVAPSKTCSARPVSRPPRWATPCGFEDDRDQRSPLSDQPGRRRELEHRRLRRAERRPAR